MYRMGILDDESLPNLTQENYGTRVGDQDRAAYGLDPDGGYSRLNPEEEDDVSSVIADAVQDEFGSRDGGTAGADRVGGGDVGAGGVGSNAGVQIPGNGVGQGVNPGSGAGNYQNINDIINNLFPEQAGSDPNWLEQFLVEHGDEAARVLGGMVMPGGGLVGDALADAIINNYWQTNQWQSPAPNANQPSQTDVDIANATPGMHDNPLPNSPVDNPYGGAVDPLGRGGGGGVGGNNSNAGFYQGGQFNPGAGGTAGMGGPSFWGYGSGFGSGGSGGSSSSAPGGWFAGMLDFVSKNNK
jgi:hypothetical protein